MQESSLKLFHARNPLAKTRMERKVQIPRGTPVIYIPRDKHYSLDVLGKDNPRLEKFEDYLKPCTVVRGANGYGWHICPYHRIFIQEI